MKHGTIAMVICQENALKTWINHVMDWWWSSDVTYRGDHPLNNIRRIINICNYHLQYVRGKGCMYLAVLPCTIIMGIARL